MSKTTGLEEAERSLYRAARDEAPGPKARAQTLEALRQDHVASASWGDPSEAERAQSLASRDSAPAWRRLILERPYGPLVLAAAGIAVAIDFHRRGRSDTSEITPALAVSASHPGPSGTQRGPQGDGKCPQGTAPCTPTFCRALLPSTPVIAAWADGGASGSFGLGANGAPATRTSPWVYPSSCADASPQYRLSSTMDGSLRVTGTVGTWSGFGLWMGCMVDLSAYGGVSVEVWGDAGPSGSLTFQVNTSPDSTSNVCSTNVGTCSGERGACSSPSVTIPVSRVPGVPVTLRWADFKGGSPNAGVDPRQITAMVWAFDWVDWGGSLSIPYPVDVSLGEVRLVP